MPAPPESLIQSIKTKFDEFQVKLYNRKGDHDYLVLAESLLIPILNALFNVSLTNTNKKKKNFPGVDLVDYSNRIGFQISIQNDLEKVKDTLETVISHHSQQFDRIVLVFLTPKQSSYSQASIGRIVTGQNLPFNVSTDILDIGDISEKVKMLASDLTVLEDIDRHMDRVLGKEREATSRQMRWEPGPIAPGLIETYTRLLTAQSPLTSEISKDYLEALQVINFLIDWGKTDQQTSDGFYQIDALWTNAVNDFCKAILYNDHEMQTDLCEGIFKIFDGSNLQTKAQLSYLLGRLSKKSVQTTAKDFLRARLAAFIDWPVDKNNELLLICRTIYISLIYLGDTKAGEEYISKLMSNARWDHFNRAFHLEYYGDATSSPAGQLYEDNVREPFTTTYEKLCRSLNGSLQEGTKSKQFEVQLYTLCSFAQHRQVVRNGSITESNLLEIRCIIKETLDKKFIHNTQLIKYIECLRVAFQKGTFVPLGAFFAEMYKVKNTRNAFFREVNGASAEPIASHLYGAYLLGKMCMPDILEEEPGYSKSKVLELILLSDLGKSIMGELSNSTLLDSMAFFGTYFGNEVALLYKDFDQRDGINYRIAKDLHRIEHLLQLYIYQFDQSLDIPDFEKWETELITAIQSREGMKIRDIFTAYYERKSL